MFLRVRGFPAAATPRRRAWPLVSRLGHISGHFGREPGRLSQVSGEPSCAFALLSGPAGADRPAMTDGPCRSPTIDRESHPAAGIFRGSITQLRHPPPTLPASIALHGQGWLPAAWLAVPGGVRLHGLHPLGSSREFQWQFPCLSPPFAPAFAWRDDSDPDPDWTLPTQDWAPCRDLFYRCHYNLQAGWLPSRAQPRNLSCTRMPGWPVQRIPNPV